MGYRLGGPLVLLLGSLSLSCTTQPTQVPSSPSGGGGLYWGKDRRGNPTLIQRGESVLHKSDIEKHHDEHVQDFSSILKQRTQSGLYGLIQIGRGSQTSNRVHDQSYKQGAMKLDMSKLTHIIHVDKEKLIVRAEPLCTMQQLVDATLPHGLLPKVVPEFKHITVGGAIMGAALESTSHAHGQFLDCCASVTLLLPDGRVEVASHTQNVELFHSLSGSYGTLAILLDAHIELQMVAASHVKVTYTLHRDIDSGIEAMQALCASETPPEFVEGLQLPHSEEIVVCQGAFFSPDMGGKLKVSNFDRPGREWYYEHVEDVAKKLRKQAGGGAAQETTRSELIPLREYLFRYDYGAFWMARPMSFSSMHTRLTPSNLMLFAMSSNFPLVRRLFGWLFSTRRLFSMLRLAPQDIVAQRMIIMDVYMPVKEAGGLVKRIRGTVPISTPLWLCPVSGCKDRQEFSPHGHHPGLLINVGIYGRVCDNEGRRYSRELEVYAAAHGGRKMLYSQNFYTEAEFWGRAGDEWKETMFDESKYRRMRSATSAENVLPDLYTKVCESARPPPSDSL
eukprot:CAMPEP_0206218820 /NCGR_PEP_ID=MMETSP0047_2-20121206/3997_1 /ASSEMBLY_ACC=CAM_ASM_000192 /TAXON_ID=195065 /ORGANISM="Chroomonas mesostigmatica_cf, Strain CCMP1168" /LENGTH=561 /DNA_ID=CAMNT_0053641337 /DNA_START=205 /DNA_END=1886 /DNA_ORIENTATION=-